MSKLKIDVQFVNAEELIKHGLDEEFVNGREFHVDEEEAIQICVLHLSRFDVVDVIGNVVYLEGTTKEGVTGLLQFSVENTNQHERDLNLAGAVIAGFKGVLREVSS